MIKTITAKTFYDIETTIQNIIELFGQWNNTTQNITSIVVSSGNLNFNTGTRITVYGRTNP